VFKPFGTDIDILEPQRSVVYEWECESVADIETEDLEEGDILDHAYGDSFADIQRWSQENPPPPGERHEIVLVRDDRYGRSWAYLKDGKLPERFAGESSARVPKRFHNEVAKEFA
jgi:hypothetical protein